MYVESNRLQRNGNTYRTVTVRESFRLDGKVMHRTVANITDLPQHAIDAVQQALRLGQTPTPAGVPQVGSSREYGASLALLRVIRQLGLDQLIYSRKEPWREDILALIVGRIVFQGSKLALTGVYQDSALWELCGHPAGKRPDVDKHAYLPMDRLLERQESIQKQLAGRPAGRKPVSIPLSLWRPAEDPLLGSRWLCRVVQAAGARGLPLPRGPRRSEDLHGLPEPQGEDPRSSDTRPGGS